MQLRVWGSWAPVMTWWTVGGDDVWRVAQFEICNDVISDCHPLWFNLFGWRWSYGMNYCVNLHGVLRWLVVLYLWSRIDFGFVTFIRLQINSQYNSDRNKMRVQFVIVCLCLVLTMGRSSSRKCGVDSRTLKRKVEKTSKKRSAGCNKEACCRTRTLRTEAQE